MSKAKGGNVSGEDYNYASGDSVDRAYVPTPSASSSNTDNELNFGASYKGSSFDSYSEEDSRSSRPKSNNQRSIHELVEYYMSDSHLSNDKFLSEQIIKNSGGYVPVRLLASYRKLKRLTSHWTEVLRAAEESDKLEISPDGSQLRRCQELPENIKKMANGYRSIISCGIFPKYHSIDKIASAFSEFGEVTSLQLHKPDGKMLPLMNHLPSNLKQIMQTNCAIITFEKESSAAGAVQKFKETNDFCEKVVEMPRKMRRYQNKLAVNYESSYYSGSDYESNYSPMRSHRNHRKSSQTSSGQISCSSSYFDDSRKSSYVLFSGHSDYSNYPSKYPYSSANSPTPDSLPRYMNKSRKFGYGSPIPPSSLSTSYLTSYTSEQHNLTHTSGPSTPTSSPWSPVRHGAGKQVIRMPKGPDETSGFSLSRKNSEKIG